MNRKSSFFISFLLSFAIAVVLFGGSGIKTARALEIGNVSFSFTCTGFSSSGSATYDFNETVPEVVTLTATDSTNKTIYSATFNGPADFQAPLNFGSGNWTSTPADGVITLVVASVNYTPQNGYPGPSTFTGSVRGCAGVPVIPSPGCGANFPIYSLARVTKHQPAFGDAGHNFAFDSNHNQIFLPIDADHDGKDDFLVISKLTDSKGVLWLGLFIGGCQPVYVPAANVTLLRPLL